MNPIALFSLFIALFVNVTFGTPAPSPARAATSAAFQRITDASMVDRSSLRRIADAASPSPDEGPFEQLQDAYDRYFDSLIRRKAGDKQQARRTATSIIEHTPLRYPSIAVCLMRDSQRAKPSSVLVIKRCAREEHRYHFNHDIPAHVTIAYADSKFASRTHAVSTGESDLTWATRFIYTHIDHELVRAAERFLARKQ